MSYVAVEVTPEEEEAWTEKYAEKFKLLVVDEAGSLPVQDFIDNASRILWIGGRDDPHTSFPVWVDEEFLDDLPPFMD